MSDDDKTESTEPKTESAPEGISGADTSTELATRVASSESDGESTEPEGISGAAPETGDDADAKGEGEDNTDKKEDVDPLDTVPEEYAFEVPEGFEPDEQLKTDWDESAKKLGLTQRQYDGAIETFAKAIASNDDKTSTEHTAKVQGWKDALSKDDSLAPNKPGWVSVATARDAFTEAHPELSESLMADLKSTGLDHHPGLARFFEWVGKSVAEGRTGIDDGEGKSPSSGSAKHRASKMFTQTPINADA